MDLRVLCKLVACVLPHATSLSIRIQADLLLQNEFRRIDMKCDGLYLIPGNAGVLNGVYPEELGPNQVCVSSRSPDSRLPLLIFYCYPQNLFGAKPGEQYVLGSDYIYAGFQYKVSEQWVRGSHRTANSGLAAKLIALGVILAQSRHPLCLLHRIWGSPGSRYGVARPQGWRPRV